MFIKEPPPNVNVPKVSKDRIDYFSNDFVEESLSQLSAPHPDPVPPKEKDKEK